MKANEAKKAVAARLAEIGLPAFKLTARTVSFEGFGYGRKVFVAIHGWNHNDHGPMNRLTEGRPRLDCCIEYPH